MLADYHIHSSFSDDSIYAMEDIIKDAIDRNLDEICFTEHVDHDVKPLFDYVRYTKEFQRCKKKYEQQIRMKRGIEFGVQIHTIDAFEADYANQAFDFVILSCHQVENKEFWTQEFQIGKTQEEYNLRYYEAILDVIEHYDKYSVLGHLDMIKRYDLAPQEYPFEKIEPLITKILKQVIKQGKGIELNTSSFRYGLSDLTPARAILKLYYDLGGRIITIGSDTHKEENLGYKLAYAKKELKKLGYKQFCTFDQMKPNFHDL